MDYFASPDEDYEDTLYEDEPAVGSLGLGAPAATMALPPSPVRSGPMFQPASTRAEQVRKGLLWAIPAFLGAYALKSGPGIAASMIGGVNAGLEKDRRNRMQDAIFAERQQDREERRRMLDESLQVRRAQIAQQAMERLYSQADSFDDENEWQSYVQNLAPIYKKLDIDISMLANGPVPGFQRRLRADASAAVAKAMDALTKQGADFTKPGALDEALDGVAVTFRGRTGVPLRALAQVAQYPILPETVPRKRAPGSGFDDYLADTIEAEEQQLERPLTPEERVEVTESARRRWTEIGWRPWKETDTADEDAGLVETVLDNPGFFDQLTPSARTRIGPKLAARGMSLGKPLSETAITKMAESRAAISSLRDLRQVLQDNEQYIGPIAGYQALNPYSDARKAQAKINLVRQRVGKALEGGVLRKEDEEKYKKILATLTDTPEQAITKVDGLIETLQRDLEIYEREQRMAGHRVGGSDTITPDAPAAGTRPRRQAAQKGERRRFTSPTGEKEVREWTGKEWKLVVP